MSEEKTIRKQIFINKRTRRMTWMICIVLPVFLVAYSWFMNHRPKLNVQSEWTLADTLIQNSDLILAVLFLLLSALPFYFVFDKKKAQARDMVPIALMAAICVVGRAAFAIVPLPNFKPVSAIIIISGVAFGPEAGYLTGALAAILSNFLFGQGPWTPWQMFCWGMIGFLAGLFYKAGFFGKVGTTAADEYGKRRKSIRLCVFGFFAGFFFGWFMNLYHIIGYVSPISWQAVFATYASSFFVDVSHGICTTMILWLVGDLWVRKLLRIKKKFGLEGEYHHYVMPPIETER